MAQLFASQDTFSDEAKLREHLASFHNDKTNHPQDGFILGSEQIFSQLLRNTIDMYCETSQTQLFNNK